MPTFVEQPSTGPRMEGVSANTTFPSPLRVDLMDGPARHNLREYLQARLQSYYEDEHGQPTYPPDQQA